MRQWPLLLSLALGTGAAVAPAAAQSPAVRFSLGDALRRARDVAPEHAAGMARVEAARRGAESASRWPNPVAEFRQENWFSGVSRDTLPLDTFAEVTQLIEVGGKRGARKGVAQAATALEEAATGLVQVQLAREVSRAYLEALRQRERHRTLTQQTADLAEMVRVMERRVALGSSPEADLLKLRTEEARAGLERVRSEVGAHRALIDLTARLDQDVLLDALALPEVGIAPTGDLAQAVARRPDVVRARRAAEVARQMLRLEEARRFPDPALNGGLKRTTGLNTAQFTVTMPIPLFNRNDQARALAEGAVRAADLDALAVERRARADVLVSRGAAVTLAAHARDARATLLEPARAAREAARAAYRAGALDVLRVVDAERVATDVALVVGDLEVEAVMAAIEAQLAGGEVPQP
jgi:cobalt-zinc-cadmium efflux system outer membrane protein